MSQPLSVEQVREAIYVSMVNTLRQERYELLDALILAVRAEQQERIVKLEWQLEASRLNWLYHGCDCDGMLVEEIASFVEHLRDGYQSTTEPVSKVARLIREKFGSATDSAPAKRADERAGALAQEKNSTISRVASSPETPE